VGIDASASAPSSVPSSDPPSATNDPAVLAAADKIRPLLEAGYAGQFTGIALRQGTGATPALEIRRIPGSDFDEFVRSQLPAVPVVFVDTAYSQQQIRRLQSRIMADSAYWEHRGVTLVGVAPGDAVTYEVEVWTPDGSAAEAAAFRGEYETSAIKVVAHAAAVAD
jgi:hypothetical protein